MKRLKEVWEVIAELLWRGFGLFLFILGAASGVGAFVAGDPMTGIAVAWGTLMLGVVGALGYAIATTGRATKETVAKAAKDAIEKAKKSQKS